MGETVSSTDNDGNTVVTTYYASGLPKTIGVSGTDMITSLEYDIYGNRTSITDPNAGTVSTEYDLFGKPTRQEDAEENVTVNTYDIAGRLLTSTLDGTTTTYSYDGQFIGNIDSISTGSSKIYYFYDTLGRLTSSTETLAEPGTDKTVTVAYAYDSYGRTTSKTWSTDYGIVYGYNMYGYMDEITDTRSNTLWEAGSQNALGQYTSVNLGDYNTVYVYNGYGEIQRMFNDRIRDMAYSFDRLGNLSYREDYLTGQKETFSYDNLNRLTGIDYSLNGGLVTAAAKTMFYDDLGNITGKTGIAAESDITYGDNGAGPNALTTITPSDGYSPLGQSISYTAFDKVSSITDTIGAGSTRNLSITYGYDKQRRKSVYTEGATTRTKYFFGDYEESVEGGVTTKYFYVSSPTGLVAVYKQTGTAAGQLYRILTDHLGSITEVISPSGTVAKQSFDAWGNPRESGDWTGEAAYALFTDRGFTGHEHMEEFYLVNMNGRVYDPVLGRFLSVDPYVQAPGFSQSFNRYAYCLNNPLVYTDPSGEFVFTILSAIFCPALIPLAIKVDATLISGTINVISNWDDISDRSDGKSPLLEGLEYFGVGGTSGLLMATGNPFLSGSVMDGGNSILRGNNLEKVAKDAFWGGVTSSLSEKLAAPLTKELKASLNIKNELLKNMIAETVVGVPYNMLTTYFFSRQRGYSIEESTKYAKTAGWSALASGIFKSFKDTYSTNGIVKFNKTKPIDTNYNPQTNLMHNLQINPLEFPPAPEIKALPPHIPTITPGHIEMIGDQWIWVND